MICLFDIQEIAEAHIFPGDGSAHVHVRFRLILFRPFIGEVMQGTVAGCTSEHIKGGPECNSCNCRPAWPTTVRWGR